MSTMSLKTCLYLFFQTVSLLNVRDRIIEFFNEYYVAQNMSLSVLSNGKSPQCARQYHIEFFNEYYVAQNMSLSVLSNGIPPDYVNNVIKQIHFNY
jgi:secreted Zn-dependent insulinase-like peptidase